jgi:co-chaperonin GroES (HSP10)
LAIEVFLHRILVKRDEQVDTDAVVTKKEMSRIGLVVAPSVQKDLESAVRREQASMDTGTVVQIGSTAYRDYGIECPIKVGDNITFAKFSGKEVTDKETEEVFVVINDEDVVAKI